MRLGARLGRAIFWGQAGRLAESSMFFVFSLVLARSLGPESYGLYALGISMAGLCTFVTLLGLGPETLGRFLPEVTAGGDAAGAAGLLKKLLLLRGAAIVALVLGIVWFRAPISARLRFPAQGLALGLVLLVFCGRSVLDLLTYFSSGLLALRRVAAAKIAGSLAAPAVFLIFWISHRATAATAWLATSAGAAAGIILLASPFAARRTPAPRSAVISVRRILAFGLFAWATNFFVFVLGDSTDVLLLGWLVGDRAAIGAYAVGAKMVFSLTGMLLGWVTLSSIATLSAAWREGGVERLVELAEAQWKFGVLCLVGPYLLLLRFAREIVALFYSSSYAASVPVIRILCALMACGLMCGFSVQAGILYALDHERLACALVGAVALFNIAAEILLVRLLGITGAAWATGISCVLLAILCTGAAMLYVPLQIPLAFIAKVAGAGLMGLAATVWMHPAALWSLGFACALYTAVFLSSLVVLKPLTGKDSALLHQVHALAGKWAQKLFVEMRPTIEEGSI